jgi:hypothetical protein
MKRLPALLLPGVLLVGGCTRVSSLDSEPMELTSQERSAVQAQVDRSREAKEWKDAWNQEVQAGADLARLEAIAVETAADGDSDAKEMFRELHAKGWTLSPAGRARLQAAVAQAQEKGDWDDAAEILILSADDPPKYAEAWALYEKAPPSDAEDVLEEIRKAREAHARDLAAAKERPAGGGR